MPSLKTRLEKRGLLGKVALPSAIDVLLSGLSVAGDDPGALEEQGSATVGFSAAPLGVLDLALTPPGPEIPFTLRYDAQPASTFQLWLRLADMATSDGQPPFSKVLQFAGGALGAPLKAARVSDTDPNLLVEAPGQKVTVGVEGLALLVHGEAGGTAALSLRPGMDSPEDLLPLKVTPPTVLLGGFGLGLTGGVVLDQSAVAAPAGDTVVLGQRVEHRPADAPAWQGLSIRKADFYLPAALPFVGSAKAETWLDVGMGASSGIALSLALRVERPGKPTVELRLECQDPTAAGLTAFVPTLVEVAVTLPLDQPVQVQGVPPFGVLAGKPLVARVRFARDPGATTPASRASVSLEGQGEQGVLSVKNDGSLPARAVVAASAFATALIADANLGGSDAAEPALVTLHELLVAGLGLSAVLTSGGRVVVHAVELASEGGGLPVGGPVTFTVDYSVDVPVIPLNLGVMSIGLAPEQPLRVRLRKVALRVDPSKGGADMLRLDYGAADMEVEDPGLWKTSDGPLGPLFDILGTRSGRGSTWVEVDLHFKLNLGPVKVSGATVRANLGGSGLLNAELRGLKASLDVPGLVDGSGAVALLKDGFAAELDVALQPLKLRADAAVALRGKMVLLALGVDLPAPIPLFNTGLGIYGIGGLFGAHARPKLADPTNPIVSQLRWEPRPLETAFEEADATTVGLQAVVGTAPDLGFSFSAKAGLFLTVPDVVVRAGLDGALFSPRKSITDAVSDPPPPGVSYRGVLVVDAAEGLTLALSGAYTVPHLVELTVPLGAHFRFADAADWYLYLGADGASVQDRRLGPIRASVLPDLFSLGADAYLMLRGKGLAQWPNREGVKKLDIADGFVAAFGFGFHFTMGLEPVCWAEVHASADLLLATRPLLLAGYGTVGGSLNLGPFSLGVDATLQFVVQENAGPYFKARVCGHVDLFFTELEGCAEIVIADDPKRVIPLPDVHPLDRVENGAIAGHNASLIDDRYRRVPVKPRDPAKAALSPTPENAPTVWPDVLLELLFSPLPQLKAGFTAGQFPALERYPSGAAARRVGGDALFYEWTLERLQLLEVKDADPRGAGTPVAGALSSAWQVGRSGTAGSRPEPVEAVLLSPQGDLWLSRLPEGKPSDTYDPMTDRAALCHARSEARMGWALGGSARWVGDGFDVPPDAVSADPLQSRVEALATPGLSWMPGVVLDAYTAQLLPSPLGFRPPRVLPLAPPLELGRTFTAWLAFGTAFWPPGLDEPQQGLRLELAQTVRLTPTEPLFDALLWLRVQVPQGHDLRGLDVTDDLNVGAWQVRDARDLGNGVQCVGLSPPHGDAVSWVTLRWRLGDEVGLIALGGVTLRARAAADAANKARADELARAKDDKTKGPLKPGEGASASRRCLLQPGKLYRLDVELSWHAELAEQDDAGKRVTVLTQDGTQYQPRGAAGPVDTKRSYWFRTATTASGEGLVPASAIDPAVRFDWRTFALETFDPEMLTRYLTGYAPAQSETFRFRKDPLNAHFRVGHVAGLAAAYGYDLKLGLRKLDAKGDAGLEQLLLTKPVALQDAQFLGPVDRIRHATYAASACELPTPGMSLEALADLEPLSWYEVYVRAKAQGPGLQDGRLEGVSFRTSRWNGPADMLVGLGFTALGTTHGDLGVPRAHGLAGKTLGEDAVYEAALDALGLSGWPVADAPRVSLLWCRDAAAAPWRFLGVMLESPEPVHRPGRVELASLEAAPAALDILRTDRVGARLLALTSQPFVPQGAARVTLALKDLAQTPAAVLSGSVAIPLRPQLEEL